MGRGEEWNRRSIALLVGVAAIMVVSVGLSVYMMENLGDDLRWTARLIPPAVGTVLLAILVFRRKGIQEWVGRSIRATAFPMQVGFARYRLLRGLGFSLRRQIRFQVVDWKSS